MDYLHFIKYQGSWYYYFSEDENKKVCRPWVRDGFLKFANGCSKTEAKNILEDMFPGYAPIHTLLFHEGPKHLTCNSKKNKIVLKKERHDVKKILNKSCYLD